MKISPKAAALTIVMIAIITCSFCAVATAQTDIPLTSNDRFTLPDENGSIGFTGNWTYQNATFTNGTWTFTNLRFNATGNIQTLPALQVSTQQSNITIYSYTASNLTFTSIVLRYSVVGEGKQTLNFGHVPRGGEWSLNLNGRTSGKNEGWRAYSSGTVIVTGAHSNTNVSIAYYVVDSGDADAEQPFYLQHSVAITAGALLAVVLVLAAAIAVRNKKILHASSANGQSGKVINEASTKNNKQES